jgi:serpin B
LAMLENGAAGPTEREIATTLHTSALSPAFQDAGWTTLAAQWAQAAAAGKITLQSANSLWTQNGLPLLAPFMSDLARYYSTGVWQVDFEHDLGAATAAINAWTKRQTHGKITQLFQKGQLTSETVLVLANAIYLDAAWAQPFDPGRTFDGPFSLGSGRTTPAKFMSGEFDRSGASAAVSATYQAVQLPYTGGRFAALAIMPRTQPLPSFVDALTPSSLSGVVASLDPAPTIELTMPRFTIASTTNLTTPLASLGMPGAFTPSADFSALSPVATWLQSAAQRVYLSVGEKGTEAAAATGISAEASAGHLLEVTVRLDHPFLFLVRDTATGAVLFAAEVTNPAE